MLVSAYGGVLVVRFTRARGCLLGDGCWLGLVGYDASTSFNPNYLLLLIGLVSRGRLRRLAVDGIPIDQP